MELREQPKWRELKHNKRAFRRPDGFRVQPGAMPRVLQEQFRLVNRVSTQARILTRNSSGTVARSGVLTAHVALGHHRIFPIALVSDCVLFSFSPAANRAVTQKNGYAGNRSCTFDDWRLSSRRLDCGKEGNRERHQWSVTPEESAAGDTWQTDRPASGCRWGVAFHRPSADRWRKWAGARGRQVNPACWQALIASPRALSSVILLPR